MKFNELTDMMQKPEPKPDTYEAGMALNQLLKIGSHAIKIHNMIDDGAEMEAWVAKKIDLASNYVKSVHGYTAGSKAGTYDDDGMSEDASGWQLVSKAKDIAKKMAGNYTGAVKQIEKLQKDLSKNSSVQKALLQFNEDAGDMDLIGDGSENLGLDPNKFDYYYDTSGAGYGEVRTKSGKAILQFEYDRDGDAEVSTMDNKTIANIKQGEQLPNNVTAKLNMIKEDAGEGHMSKSQLYQTAKMAIELLDMIKKGDDLEGWVQTKLNLAADYLQAVYHYEDYQKLNPYREELDSSLIQRHAGIIQKHLDEILERKCRTEDVDTKPGMMRILKKRVNEVEKEIAKENRKETDEAALEEGKIKDWAKSLAMAGVFVAGLAGVGSIQDAINNSVPAIQAMNTALEMAKEKGDDNLVAQIEKDLKGAKLRLDIGKDLNQVKYLQDKYEKFIQTESLTYESKLQINLNQRLK